MMIRTFRDMNMRLLTAALVFTSAASLASAADLPPAGSYIEPGKCAEGATGDVCSYVRSVWPKNYADAMAGKYLGQVNVSYCLSTGCSGAVKKDPVMGCAWRIVILHSGSAQVTKTDLARFRYFCGPDILSAADRDLAIAQSRKLRALFVPTIKA
jgi:hypothetical protein